MSDLAATNCGGCGCNGESKVPLTGKPPRLHGLGGFLSFTLVFPFSLCSLPLPAL